MPPTSTRCLQAVAALSGLPTRGPVFLCRALLAAVIYCSRDAQVELAALPRGVPERLAVSCNGRSATFLVRSQRVVLGGAEMTPSRFEQLAGRGDAKKWKTSIVTKPTVSYNCRELNRHTRQRASIRTQHGIYGMLMAECNYGVGRYSAAG